MTAADARKARALGLQARIVGAEPPLPETARELVSAMRARLRAASDEGLLATGPAQVQALLKTVDERDGKVAITGGYKDFRRTGQHPRFVREDGAWFHFTLTVAPRRGRQLDLLAYDFGIVFPDGAAPAFVRFDLNPPDHHNEEEGLRSHVHPGTDDFSAPSPLMSPLEILDVLLHDLRLRRKEPRT